MEWTKTSPVSPMAQAAAGLLFLVFAIAPAFARADTLIDWSAEKDGNEKTYEIDGLRLTLTATKNGRGESPRLEVKSPNGPGATVFGAEQPLSISANLRVTHLDPEYSKIDVMFGAYNGGAHCCIVIKVVSLIGDEWRVADLGPWDGDGMPEPQEAHGKVALAFIDNAFLYAFAAYVSSAAPVKILRIENGEVVDASTDPDFKYLNQQNMAENRKRCGQHENGACAAYVASAARLGLFSEAWNFMRRNYDRHSDWSLDFCDVPGPDKCARSVTFDSYPRALDWFLHKHGYLPPASANQPALGMRQTAMLCGRPVEYVLDPNSGRSPILGIWSGNWNNPDRLCGGLIVQRIRSDGVADIAYLYGPSRPNGRVQWRQQQRTALVSPNGDLTFQDDQGGTFVFNLESTGILSAKFIGRSGNLSGVFSRSP